MAIDKPAIEGGTPVRTEPLPYATQWIGEEEIAAVVETLKSVWITTGPRTAEFQDAFAGYVGAKYAVGLNSCTGALTVSVAALGVGPGDEVITTPLTFAATVLSIIYSGATPVLADIKMDTYNIDPASIEKKITGKTKAIIPVHYAGNPADMDDITAIAKQHGLKVIEDGAHAVGAEYRGRRIGTFGDMTCFSFHAIKNMTSVEGGMITTDDAGLASKAKALSFFGIDNDAYSRADSDKPWQYDVSAPGFKCNMPDICAAIGLVQLGKINEFNRLRASYVDFYNEAFSGVDELIKPVLTPGSKSSHHLYVIRITPGALRVDRDRVLSALRTENIYANIHYRPIYRHSYFERALNLKREDFPVCEEISESIITLPLFPKMTRRDVQDVVDALTRIVSFYKR